MCGVVTFSKKEKKKLAYTRSFSTEPARCVFRGDVSHDPPLRSVAHQSRSCVEEAAKQKVFFLCYLFVFFRSSFVLRMTTTGHSVTESSTRVRKDADGGQQDSSGVVHDFMEPTLAIPAHLKIDVSLSLSLSLTTRTVAPNPPMQCRITSTEAPLYGVFTWLYLETYWCIRGPVQFPYGKGPDVIRVGLSSLYNFYFYFRKKKKIFSFLVSSWRVALNLKRKAEARPTPRFPHIHYFSFLSLSLCYDDDDDTAVCRISSICKCCDEVSRKGLSAAFQERQA